MMTRLLAGKARSSKATAVSHRYNNEGAIAFVTVFTAVFCTARLRIIVARRIIMPREPHLCLSSTWCQFLEPMLSWCTRCSRRSFAGGTAFVCILRFAVHPHFFPMHNACPGQHAAAAAAVCCRHIMYISYRIMYISTTYSAAQQRSCVAQTLCICIHVFLPT